MVSGDLKVSVITDALPMGVFSREERKKKEKKEIEKEMLLFRPTVA